MLVCQRVHAFPIDLFTMILTLLAKIAKNISTISVQSRWKNISTMIWKFMENLDIANMYNPKIEISP